MSGLTNSIQLNAWNKKMSNIFSKIPQKINCWKIITLQSSVLIIYFFPNPSTYIICISSIEHYDHGANKVCIINVDAVEASNLWCVGVSQHIDPDVLERCTVGCGNIVHLHTELETRRQSGRLQWSSETIFPNKKIMK